VNHLFKLTMKGKEYHGTQIESVDEGTLLELFAQTDQGMVSVGIFPAVALDRPIERVPIPEDIKTTDTDKVERE
jgi:hypothetical protein